MKAQKQNSFLKVGLVTLLVVGLGLVIALWVVGDARKQVPDTPQSTAYRGLATGAVSNFLVSPDRPLAPDFTFQNAQDQPLSLKDWQGRVVLLNLWATWCGPCRQEMPTLAALQQQLGSKDFEVVAVSLDAKGVDAAQPFLKKVNAEALAVYVDPTTKVLDQFQAPGLPATYLIDRHSRVIGTLLGPADWNSAEAQALIKQATAEP